MKSSMTQQVIEARNSENYGIIADAHNFASLSVITAAKLPSFNEVGQMEQMHLTYLNRDLSFEKLVSRKTK